jgi:hypothetical protein
VIATLFAIGTAAQTAITSIISQLLLVQATQHTDIILNIDQNT